MKRARAAVIATAVVAAATLAFAQKPDFSGRWAPDTAASGAPGGRYGGGRALGGPITVTQTADTLTVERSMMGGENKMVLTFKLDGSESKNQMMGRGGETSEATSVARWDGSTLTITTKREMGGRTLETTETWSVAGDTLTIESTGGRGSQKRVYKKST